jgi:outer membrane cobalamin receptor
MVFVARFPAAAQSPSDTTGTAKSNAGEIHGHVVRAAGQTPIGSASVGVTNVVAGSTMISASTTSDGHFRVENLAPGLYRVRVRAIGYAPRDTAPVEISLASPSADIGTVALNAQAVELQSQQITGQRQDVQLAPDRNTYVVGDMPTTKGGTALDILRNVPGVDVDIDYIVSLRGNSGVVVQINGRPSPMKPAQLGNFLAQLPADIVDKVEVIPNPSARDDPTGVAGIINIVLKQKADAGIGGGLTFGAGTTGHVDAGGNVGYQGGPWSLFGSYNFLHDNRPRREAIFRENRYLDPLTYLDESGLRSRHPLANTLTGSADYALGTHDNLSADVVFSTRNQEEAYRLVYSDLNTTGDLTGMSDRVTTGTGSEYSLQSTLGYKHVFADKSHKLSTELRFVRGSEGGPSDIVSRTLSLDATPTGTPALETQTSWEHPREYSAKLDYVRPLSSLVRMETGYKGSLQRFPSTLDYQVFDTTLAAYRPDSTRISDFSYNQDVNAAYGMLAGEMGKFQLQGGLRVERANTRFHLNTLGATYDNSYNSLFPSGLIAYNIDDAHQVKLSYSTRIRRPDDTDLLDPTPRYADPLNLQRGNPYLKPEYIRALELGIQRTADRMTLQLTPFFRHTLDAIRTIRTIDTAGVVTRTFANVATSDAYGTDANIALSGGLVSGFVGASAFRQVSNGANLAPGLNAKTFGLTTRTNVSFHVSSSLDMQALVSYQAPMIVEQGRNASRTQVSLAARKKLYNDQLSLTLRAIDPFNTSREIFTMSDPRIYQVSNRANVIRGLLFSANWTFGRPPKHGRDPNDLVGPDN